MQPSILAIADDPSFERHLTWLLHEREFCVQSAVNANALSSLEATKPNAVLVEVAPTVASTAFAVKRLRTAFRAPIITLGSNESQYEVEYLRECGADHHLRAHERWSLIHCLRGCLSMLPSDGTIRRFPALVVDENGMRATLRGLPVQLSPIEYALLARLVRRPYCIVSSAELVDEIRQHHRGIADRTIRASIHCLRRKVEDDPRKPKRLVTVLGSGYVFRPDV